MNADLVDSLRAARLRQGLSPTITDPAVLGLLAALLAKPVSRRKAAA